MARTIAKQVIDSLSTKAGCECVAHILQTFIDLDSEATIMSIDGVGPYDLISRNSWDNKSPRSHPREDEDG